MSVYLVSGADRDEIAAAQGRTDIHIAILSEVAAWLVAVRRRSFDADGRTVGAEAAKVVPGVGHIRQCRARGDAIVVLKAPDIGQFKRIISHRHADGACSQLRQADDCQS